jgi:hypothetical protein
MSSTLGFKALLGAALCAVVLLSGCATNSMTGRTQMTLVSDEQVSRQSLSYYSAMVGDYRKKEKVIEQGPVKDRITQITNRLIAQAVLYRPADGHLHRLHREAECHR